MHVIATAGHVDHGKSTLIHRLTGIDPDRLAEEKARGLTIDLGFAWLTLPSGREAGVVDVPGHERFVHNMLAGVGSVDAALFVVAANEGWKPQSEEHLAILDLLGARASVVAVTKRDVVDGAVLERTCAAVRRRLAGTSLERAEIVAVSAVTGDGLDDLVAAVDRMLDQAGDPHDVGRARVFVDRSFSVKGAGTVVTGTLTGGVLSVGDHMVVLPAGLEARVRSIQSHKESRAEAVPVSRVALNLVGVDRAQIRRGDAIVHPGRWRATRVLDIELRSVRSLRHDITPRAPLKLYIGSAEVDARVTFYDRPALQPGDAGFARATLSEPVVAAPFDRVVLRDAGRRETVAGGTVLDAHPPPLGRGADRAARALALRQRADAGLEQLTTLVVAERGVVRRDELEMLAGTAAAPEAAVLLPSYACARDRFDAMAAAIRDALDRFHRREPLAAGMAREDLRGACGIGDQRLFAEMLDALDDVVAEGAVVRRASHRVVLDDGQRAARERLLAALDAAPFSPPPFAEILGSYGAGLVRALLDAGALVRVAPDLVFAREHIDTAKRLIADAVASEGPLTAARIKDLLGTTRKYAIPLLEHLDATGFTRRRGDVREVAG